MLREEGIRILLIEDVPADVELVESELRHGGVGFRFSREAFLYELQQ